MIADALRIMAVTVSAIATSVFRKQWIANIHYQHTTWKKVIKKNKIMKSTIKIIIIIFNKLTLLKY